MSIKIETVMNKFKEPKYLEIYNSENEDAVFYIEMQDLSEFIERLQKIWERNK